MIEPLPRPERLVLILGIQRSGSTWLANIFDHREDTLLFMEPFAPYAQIFPEAPPTSVFLTGEAPQLAELFGRPLIERLGRVKTLVARRAATDPAWFRWERRAWHWLRRLERWLPGRVAMPLHRRLERHHLVNLNRFDSTYPLSGKHRAPRVWAIKELRLAGWSSVLREALPGTPKIVTLRHPMANVHSILGWFKRGRLGELQADLARFLDLLSAQSAAEPYRGLIDRCRTGSLAHRVALYWRVQNEAVVRGLEGSPGFQLVVHEELASAPLATIRRVFEAAGLPASPGAEAYVTYSSESGTEVAPTSPTDTNRNSAEYYRGWQAKIAPEVEDAVAAIVADSFLLPLFEPYYRSEAGRGEVPAQTNP
jgi:hypothetical protein